MKTIILRGCLILFLLGCKGTWVDLFNPMEMFTHPRWRGTPSTKKQWPIKYDYYYYLIDEYEWFHQQGPRIQFIHPDFFYG